MLTHTQQEFIASVFPNSDQPTFLSYEHNGAALYQLTYENITYRILDCQSCPEYAIVLSHITNAFKQAGINVSEIIESDFDSATLIILETGGKSITEDMQKAPEIWLPHCLQLLHELQTQGGQHIIELPELTSTEMLSELSTFSQYFIAELLRYKLSHDQEALLNHLTSTLVDSALSTPYTWIHRNYNCSSILKTNDESLALTTLQHAAYGPITNDVANLLNEVSHSIDTALLSATLDRAYIQMMGSEKYPHDYERFLHDITMMRLYQALKSLGNSARVHKHQASTSTLSDMHNMLETIDSLLQSSASLNHYTGLFHTISQQLHDTTVPADS